MTYLTAPQAAGLLGISPEQVRRLCADGRIPAIEIGRGGRRVWRITSATVLPRQATTPIPRSLDGPRGPDK